MATKGDHHVSKIGPEAFGLLEETFPSRYPPPQGPHVHCRPVPPSEEAVLNNFEAAKKYGGVVFVDPRKRKPVQVRPLYYRVL